VFAEFLGVLTPIQIQSNSKGILAICGGGKTAMVGSPNRCEELEAYLEKHPNGHFAGLARACFSTMVLDRPGGVDVSMLSSSARTSEGSSTGFCRTSPRAGARAQYAPG
jgi:hypothetical protein